MLALRSRLNVRRRRPPPLALFAIVATLAGCTSRAPAQGTPVQINCGGSAVSGTNWVADEDFSAGSAQTTSNTISTTGVTNPAPQAVYQSQRYNSASFTYTITGLTAKASYTVRLHFAEFQYSSAGQRVFTVTDNGSTWLKDFDIYAAAGAEYAAVVETKTVSANTSGDIVLAFNPVTGDPAVNGIEVLAGATTVLGGEKPQPEWADVVPYDTMGAGDGGPSSANAVNLASGDYENQPPPDIREHNPNGPQPSFTRTYRAYGAYKGYSSPGLALGWTDNYDLVVTGTSGSWGNLTFTYPNHATEKWTPVLSGSVPTGAFTLPAGTPYTVTGVPSGTTGEWTTLTLTQKNQTAWTFMASTGDLNEYLLAKITAVTGHYITLNHDSGDRITTIQDDAPTPNTLMAFTYGNSGTLLSLIQENSDTANPRFVKYGDASVNGKNCLETVTVLYDPNTDGNNPAYRWQYAYNTIVAGIPFMSSVTGLSPTGSGSQTSSIGYDSDSGVAGQCVDANANSHVYTYGPETTVQADEPGQILDLQWTQLYGTKNNNTGDTDANSNSELVAYGDSKNPLEPTSFTNRDGQIVTVYYDQGASGHVGNITEIDQPVGDGGTLMTKLTYDYSFQPLGLLTQIQTTGSGGASKTPTNFKYYAATDYATGALAGMVSEVDSPQPGSLSGSGAQVATNYSYVVPQTGSSLGDVSEVAVPSPDQTLGRQVVYKFGYVNDPSGQFVQNETRGEPVWVEDPLSHYAQFRWTLRGDLAEVIDADNNATVIDYNSNDQVSEIDFPNTGIGPDPAKIIYKYAFLGGPLIETDVYDENGVEQRVVTDSPGPEGELKQQTGNAENGEILYDSLYRSKDTLDGDLGQHETARLFNSVGALQTVDLPNVNQGTHFDQLEGHQYDNDYNLQQYVDGLNRLTTLTWADSSSGDDRLESITFPSGTLPNRVLSYDQFGRVVQIQDGSGVSANTYQAAYDDLDQVVSTTTTYSNYAGTAQLHPIQVSYGFNNDGSRAGMMVQDTNGGAAYTFAYLHDDAGRLYQITPPWNSGLQSGSEKLVFGYSANNWLGSASNSLVTTAYTYNQRGFLTQELNNAANAGTPAPELSYFTNGVYDASGNLTQMTWDVPHQFCNNGGFCPLLATSATMAYGYSGEYTLSSETSNRNGTYNASYSGNYVVDAAEFMTQLLSYAFSGNNDNQVAKTGYAYDGDGDPTPYPWLDPFGSGDQTLSVAWNVNDQLTAFGSYFTAGWRPDGLRAFKHSGSSTIHFIYDGFKLVAEYDDSNNLVDLYAWGPNGLDERSLPNGDYYAYTFDPSGNLVQRHSLTGRNFSALIDYTAAYDAYGEQRGAFSIYSDEEATGQDCVGFAGQWGGYTDQETQGYGMLNPGTCVSRQPLVLMGQRYYDPQTGRHTNRNPDGDIGGLNLYAYADDNPVTGVDPLGTGSDFDFSSWLRNGQMAVDTAGLVPGLDIPCGAISATISAIRGDWLGAALSLSAMIPIAGELGEAGKVAKDVEEGAEAARAVAANAPNGSLGGMEI